MLYFSLTTWNKIKENLYRVSSRYAEEGNKFFPKCVHIHNNKLVILEKFLFSQRKLDHKKSENQNNHSKDYYINNYNYKQNRIQHTVKSSSWDFNTFSMSLTKIALAHIKATRH